MKKIFWIFLCFVLLPIKTYAYSINTSGMDSSVASLLQELSASWPSNMDEGRVEVVRQAALMINKGTIYGGHTGICYSGVPPSLDCSAYVSLAYHRAMVTEVGCDWYTGSYTDRNYFTNISESSLRPGDVGLNNDTLSTDNHIGIFIGIKNGQNVWLHSSTVNGVSGPQVKYGNFNFVVFKSYNHWNEVHVNSNSESETYEGIGGELGGSITDSYADFNLISSNNFDCKTIFYNVSNGNREETFLKKILDGVFVLMRIFAPILLISLSIIDLIKAFVNPDTELKKVLKKIIKRLIITIILIFLPSLLNLLFNIFGLYDLSNCGIS